MEGTMKKFNATVVAATSPDEGNEPVKISLFTSDGDPLTVGAQMPLQADIVAADLAALKVDFNLLLGKLKTAGLMASS